MAFGVRWWAIPAAIVGGTIAYWRPGPWGWLTIGLLLCNPGPVSIVAAGGSTMWVAAGVAAGLMWGWPAALLLLRPRQGHEQRHGRGQGDRDREPAESQALVAMLLANASRGTATAYGPSR